MPFQKINTITAVELKQWFESGRPFRLYDIRSSKDFDAYHIPGAMNILKEDVYELLDDLQDDELVVICCKYGLKSPPLIKSIQSEKKDIKFYSLKEGIYEWAKEFESDKLFYI